MPVIFTLVDHGQIVTLTDPAGSDFDAAGDFDRLLPLESQLPNVSRPSLAVLSRVDAYGTVEFTSTDMSEVAQDAAAVRARHAALSAAMRARSRSPRDDRILV